MTMSDNATPEMVTLTIDGQEVTVPKGTTLLKAAQEFGPGIPHYCFHEGLSSPAMCRLCLVEVEGAPKLLPSCVTQAMPGQVVHTESEKAASGRKGVLEFYLVNHPLDCPICDQSGECKLQDYVYAEGREAGRGREPKRVFGRDDFGGDVLFYGDRCVMCTRCVRFMTEIEQNSLLTVVERGNRSVIDTFFDSGLGEASWAGNVVDICPVGALVSKDFLYKARAWDLEHTASICPSCSQGCNIELHTRDNVVQRLKPRENLEVNGYWMCDEGRANYEAINRGDRMEEPLVQAGGTPSASSWSDALGGLVDQLRGASAPVMAVVSAQASNEDIAALTELVSAVGGGEIVFRSARAEAENPLPGYTGLARRLDLVPNRAGAEAQGAVRVGDDDGKGGLDDVSTHDGVVIVLGDELADQADTFASGASLFVYLGQHASEASGNAHVQLPITTFAEQDGTFTNHTGRVQRFRPALDPPGAARPAWLVLGALTAALADGEGPTRADEAFARLAENSEVYRGLSYESLATAGAQLAGTVGG